MTPELVDLEVGGMTCAVCAGRIERRLNKLDGVEASVNDATERARVSFDPAKADPAALVAAVEAIGYSAALPRATASASERATQVAPGSARLEGWKPGSRPRASGGSRSARPGAPRDQERGLAQGRSRGTS